MKILFRIAFVVGLILLALILWSIDRQRTWAIISGANGYLLLLGIILISPEALFKALKLQSLIISQSPCSVVDALVVYSVGIPFGLVTPAKAGDLVKVYSLRQRTGMGLPESFAIGVLDRLLDLLALVVFAVVGVLLLLANHAGNWALVFLIGFCLVGVALLLALTNKGLVARAAGLGKALIGNLGSLAGSGAMIKSAFEGFYTGMELARKGRGALAMGFLFALAASAAISTRSYVFGTALGLQVAWLNFVFLIPLVTLVELLPVSILGFGTREYAMITIFAFLGVDREEAVSLSLAAFVLSIVPLALGGYLVALKEHLRPGDVRESRQKGSSQSSEASSLR